MAMMFLVVPALGTGLSDVRQRELGPEQAPALIGWIWSTLDAFIKVRCDLSQATLFTAFKMQLASLWWTLSLPLLGVLALQLAIRDKQLACRVHYWTALAMAISLLAIIAVSCRELVIALFQHQTLELR
jgi:hypothetical protein